MLLRPKPKTPTEWLKKVFAQIYDDYFKKLDNKDATRYLELLEQQAQTETKIAIFKAVLQFHWETPQDIWDHPTVVQARMSNIEKLNQFMDYPIDLDGDFDSEIEQALNVSLGIMANDLSEIEMELEQLRKVADKTKFEFYDSLQNIDEINGQNSDPNLLLASFVSKEKSAIKKIERQRLKTAS